MAATYPEDVIFGGRRHSLLHCLVQLFLRCQVSGDSPPDLGPNIMQSAQASLEPRGTCGDLKPLSHTLRAMSLQALVVPPPATQPTIFSAAGALVESVYLCVQRAGPQGLHVDPGCSSMQRETGPPV